MYIAQHAARERERESKDGNERVLLTISLSSNLTATSESLSPVILLSFTFAAKHTHSAAIHTEVKDLAW